MLKIGSTIAALILTVASFSTSAEAQRGFSGHVGGFGPSMGAISGPRLGAFSGAGMGVAPRMAPMGAVAPRIGGFAGPGHYGPGGFRYAYGHPGYRYRHGNYWPYFVGAAALGVAAAWPYYDDYGYDSCYRVRRVWTPYGWTWQQIDVCGYPYGYPYGYPFG